MTAAAMLASRFFPDQCNTAPHKMLRTRSTLAWAMATFTCSLVREPAEPAALNFALSINHFRSRNHIKNENIIEKKQYLTRHFATGPHAGRPLKLEATRGDSQSR